MTKINMIMSIKIMIRPTRVIGSVCRILPPSPLREKLAVQHVIVRYLDLRHVRWPWFLQRPQLEGVPLSTVGHCR